MKKPELNPSHTRENGEDIFARAYHGPVDARKHKRGVNQVEVGFVQSGWSFDTLLADSLLVALGSNRSSITVLDIGSGDAGLAINFLSAPKSAPRTRKLLREVLRTQKELRINLVGLTDSPSKDRHLQELPMEVSEGLLGRTNKKINNMISAVNVAYTLTRSQSLDRFFQARGINQVDLILATKSLRYLSPAVFREVLYTGIDNLRAAGRFVVNDYTGDLTWSLGGRNFGFHSNAERYSDTERFVAVLNGYNSDPLPSQRARLIVEELDLANYEKYIERAIRFYLGEKPPQSPLIKTQDGQKIEIDKVAEALAKNPGLPSLTPETVDLARCITNKAFPAPRQRLERLKKMAELTVATGFAEFEEAWRLTDLIKKTAIVEGIPGVKLDWLSKDPLRGGTFVITKD